jgi:hypothetical protein
MILIPGESRDEPGPCLGHGGGLLSEWSAAERDLVPLRVVVGGVAYTVGVGLLLGWLDAPAGDLGKASVEVVDEDGVHGMTGMLGPVLNGHRSMLGKFPHASVSLAMNVGGVPNSLSYQASAAG